MRVAPAIRLFVPGDFQDAFVYMGTLLAVTAEREIVALNFDQLVNELPPPADSGVLYTLFLLRNNMLGDAGAQALLGDRLIRKSIRRRFESTEEHLLAIDHWDSRLDYRRVLGDGALLDLQIYNSRLFAATTAGVVQTDLLSESSELRFSAPLKRTDARCMSISVRYGTVAASCGSDGLQMSYDEFSELTHDRPVALRAVPTDSSVRSAWLGYNFINYLNAVEAQGFKSSYQRADRGQRSTIVTGLTLDPALIRVEARDTRPDVDFRYNAHSTFFTHYESGDYELRTRRWASGRLGEVEVEHTGRMSRPLSTHETLGGFVAETYDEVNLIDEDGVSLLFSGEAIAVRTFPHSQWYKNLVLIVAEDGIHVVSPLTRPWGQ
jgi:hypothetical protein